MILSSFFNTSSIFLYGINSIFLLPLIIVVTFLVYVSSYIATIFFPILDAYPISYPTPIDVTDISAIKISAISSFLSKSLYISSSD